MSNEGKTKNDHISNLARLVKFKLLGDTDAKPTLPDILKLSAEVNLSKGTLEGIFGLDKSKQGRNRRTSTLDALAAYIGYENFAEFRRGTAISIGDQELDAFIDSLRTFYINNPGINSVSNTHSIIGDEIANVFQNVTYVNRSVLQTKYDYLTFEKKYHLRDRERHQMKRDSIYKLGTEIATDTLLTGSHQAIIIGNAGVGKTTYAKWICYNWAKGRILNHIPVYVICRNLDTSLDNPLLKYVSKSYGKLSAKVYTKFIDRVVFVLDGYDEASLTQRDTLERSILDLTVNSFLPRFALFSRPYALIDSTFKKVAQYYEIIGFNQEDRLEYIKRHLNRNGLANKIASLTKTISENNILNELSRIPLMLRNIVELVVGGMNDAVLKEIESEYDLIRKAFEFLLRHHTESSKSNRITYLEKVRECYPFITQMELELKYVYVSDDPLDENYTYALTLNEIGIGRLEESESEWIFSFVNIHFQTLFSAEHISINATPDIIVELATHPSYWHLLKMIIARLIRIGQTNTISEVLDKLSSHRRLDSFEYRLFFMVMSELNHDQINHALDDIDIRNMLELHDLVFEDPVWSALITDGIIKLYLRLSDNRQKHFENIFWETAIGNLVIPDLNSIQSLNLELTANLVIPPHKLMLTELLSLPLPSRWIGIIMSKLIVLEELSLFAHNFIEERYTNEIAPTSEEFQVEEMIDDCRHQLYLFLDLVDTPENLLKYKDYLKEKCLTALNHNRLIARVYSKTTSLNELHIEFDVFIKKNEKDVTDLYYLSLLSVMLTHVVDSGKAENLVLTKLNDLDHVFSCLIKEKEIHIGLYIASKVNYALALSQTNNLDFLSLLAEANIYLVEGYHVLDIVDLAAYRKIIDNFFAAINLDEPEELHIHLLCSHFLSTDVGYLIIDEYFEQIKTIVQRFILKNSDNLLSYTINNRASKSDPEIETSNVIIQDIPDVLHFPLRIKKLIDEFLKWEHLEIPYVKLEYVPFLMSCEVPFYEEKYWSFLFENLIPECENGFTILELFYTNITIYNYPSNLPYVYKTWKFLFEYIDGYSIETILGIGSEILLICYRSVRMAYSIDKKAIKEDFIFGMRKLLLQKIRIDTLYGTHILYHESDIEALCIFTLMGHITHDTNFKITDKFIPNFERLDMLRRYKILNGLIEICNGQCDLLRDLLGTKMYNYLEEYATLTFKGNEIASKALINKIVGQ